MQLSKLTRRALSTLILALGMFVALDLRSSVANVFISQGGAGAQDGLTCGSAKPVSFFNTGANWGAGGAQIGPDTIVNLCGTITTTLAFQGSGTSGHPITLFFQPGAKISQAFCGAGGSGACLFIGAAAWLVIDGGTDCGSSVLISPFTPESLCNGIIEATANGSGQNQIGNPGIIAQQSDHVEMKNVLIRNIYKRTVNTDQVHVTINGLSGDGTQPFALDANPSSNFHFHHSTVHDGNWLLEFITCGSAPLGNIEVDHSYFYNDNHGVAGGVCTQTANRFLIHDNHFGTQANWSPPCCTLDYGFHHDGIHWYATNNAGLMTNLLVYNNLFNEDWSHNSTTAFVYTEGQNSPGFTEYLWNNVAIMDPNTNMGNGAFVIVVGANGTAKMWNNTAYGGALQGGPVSKTQGSHTDFRNNVTVTTSNGFGALMTYDPSQTDAFFDYNIWQNSNVQPFCKLVGSNCNGANYTDLKALLTAGSGQESHGQLVANAGLNSDGTLISGGVTATANGANLSALCTGDFASLCFDTSSGGMRTPTARPGGTLTPWTPGAFNRAGGAATPGISVAPNPLAFGGQLVGSSTPSNTTVTSIGSAALVLSNPALVLGGTDAGQFSLTGGGCANGQTVTTTCSANVTFSPTSAGAKTATLTINSNAPTSPTVVNLTGTGTAPATPVLTPAPTSAPFGNVNVGQTSAPTTITLTSSGATVNLGNPFFTIAGTVFARSGGTCINSMVLTPPASCTVLVTATPAALGAASSNLVISSNSSPAVSVPLSVTGTAASLAVAPLSFDFGSQIQGTQGPLHNFTITNNGTGAATMGNPYFSFSDAQFARVSPGGADCTNGGSLAPGANCLISVAFTPSAPGARSGTLSILSNAPTVTSALTGTGTASTPAPVMTPANFAFPSTTTGTTSPTTVTFTLTNNGSSLTLANPPGVLTGADASDFTLIGGTCAAGTVLGTTASCTYTYNFHPAAAGAKAARANSTGSVTTSSGLTGTGVAPVLSIQITPRPLSFPNQTIGVISAVALATVTNNGAASVTIATGGAVLGGANSADFSISAGASTTCHDGTVLAVAATCNYGLQITPAFAAPPAESATLTVTTTAGVSDFIQLNGSGVALFPPPSPAPAQLVGITLPGYFVNWYGPADFFGIVGSGFVTGKTAITLDGQPLPTTCLNAESCSATLPLAMVLLPGFAGSPHTIGVK